MEAANEFELHLLRRCRGQERSKRAGIGQLLSEVSLDDASHRGVCPSDTPSFYAADSSEIAIAFSGSVRRCYVVKINTTIGFPFA